jgi:N-acyl-D-amino-acid deacylase
MDFDLVITRGTIIDGTGRPRFRADVGIRDGRLAAVASGERLEGRQTLDATGLAVAPGFIDAHSHADWVLPLQDHDEILAPLVLQGITTLVAGQCGFSLAPVTPDSAPLLDRSAGPLKDRSFPYRWHTMAEALDILERDGVLLNAALLVGHCALRYVAMGERARAAALPTSEDVDVLCRLTQQALAEGAFGLSAGLAYVPGVFARDEELLPLLRVVAEEGSVFTVHGRAYSWVSPLYRPMVGGTPHNVRSVRDLLELARKSGVRLQLSHQIFVGRRTWRTYPTVLRDIEQAAGDGVDVAFDAFPYTLGNTEIKVVFPDWFLDGFSVSINDPRALRRLRWEINLTRLMLGLDYRDITLMYAQVPELADLEGLDFDAIARRLGVSCFEAYIHVARLSAGEARILINTYSGDDRHEEPLQAVLAHPLCAFMTDTILTRHGLQNPASFGTFPRILGRYSRDLGLFSLEEAVRRMTSFPAGRMGLVDVGRVAQGAWGDLVVFDPATVADNTTSDRPEALPTGIHAVLISGQVVAQGGKLVGSRRWGRVLRKR